MDFDRYSLAWVHLPNRNHWNTKMEHYRKDERMEEQPSWVQFNRIGSNLSGSARWASHACCSHVEISLFERLWIHSNSIRSSLTGKDHYLEPTDTAQYHLRRIGWEYPFKAHRLPLMMTDLMQARGRSDIKRISLFYLSP